MGRREKNSRFKGREPPSAPTSLLRRIKGTNVGLGEVRLLFNACQRLMLSVQASWPKGKEVNPPSEKAGGKPLRFCPEKSSERHRGEGS